MNNDFLYIQNDGIDILSPTIAMTEITSIVCDMLEENLNYTSKHGLTDTAKTSRKRLLSILDITETVNKISTDNATLKLYNLNLLSQNQLLHNQLAEIKRQERLGNSI